MVLRFFMYFYLLQYYSLHTDGSYGKILRTIGKGGGSIGQKISRSEGDAKGDQAF